jgi:RimJ/RimL family protein N-acetyltransferase
MEARVTNFLFASARLGFRNWRPEDRAVFAVMNSDPAIMEFFPRLLSREESDAFADRIERHLRERGYGLWAAEEKETGGFIGFIGLQYTAYRDGPDMLTSK